MLLSPAEKDYITRGVEANLRSDGRTRDDIRPFFIETGLISQASGSCRCQLDGTDLLVGIKVDIGTTQGGKTAEQLLAAETEEDETGNQSSDRGQVQCNVECSPSATRILDARQVEQLQIKCTQFMNRLFNGNHGGIDLSALSIVPGASFWILHIDVLVLDFAGNLFDAMLLATRAALANARMPRCTTHKVGNRMEFDVSEEETEPIPGFRNVPVSVTFSKIGKRHIVDASLLEELCTDVRLIVAVNPKGQICTTMKDGNGQIEPSLVADIIQRARSIGLDLISQLDSILDMDTDQESQGYLI